MFHLSKPCPSCNDGRIVNSACKHHPRSDRSTVPSSPEEAPIWKEDMVHLSVAMDTGKCVDRRGEKCPSEFPPRNPRTAVRTDGAVSNGEDTTNELRSAHRCEHTCDVELERKRFCLSGDGRCGAVSNGKENGRASLGSLCEHLTCVLERRLECLEGHCVLCYVNQCLFAVTREMSAPCDANTGFTRSCERTLEKSVSVAMDIEWRATAATNECCPWRHPCALGHHEVPTVKRDLHYNHNPSCRNLRTAVCTVGDTLVEELCLHLTRTTVWPRKDFGNLLLRAVPRVTSVYVKAL